MATNSELKPTQKMRTCYRCGERKEEFKFRENQPYWCRQCIRCEASPVGEMPIRETSEHRRPIMESNQEYPGGFDSHSLRQLLDSLVNAHISKAMSGEKMALKEKDADLSEIRQQLVMAAHFVRSVIEEKEGEYLIGNSTADAWENGRHIQGEIG